MSLLSDLAETVTRLDSGSVGVYDRRGRLRIWLNATGTVGVYDQRAQRRVALGADGVAVVNDRNGQRCVWS